MISCLESEVQSTIELSAGRFLWQLSPNNVNGVRVRVIVVVALFSFKSTVAAFEAQNDWVHALERLFQVALPVEALT